MSTKQPLRRSTRRSGASRKVVPPRVVVADANTSGAHERIFYDDEDRRRINCAGYALGINMRLSEPVLTRRKAFLQVRNFAEMVTGAMNSPTPNATLCKQVNDEVVRMGVLRMPKGGSIGLIRRSKPAASPVPAAFAALGVAPLYYRIAVFAAASNDGERSDFHFAREYKPGRWTHKPGESRVTERDTAGFPLHPSTSAANGRLRMGKDGPPYRFCSYMWVVSRETRVELASKLKLGVVDALVYALERT